MAADKQRLGQNIEVQNTSYYQSLMTSAKADPVAILFIEELITEYQNFTEQFDNKQLNELYVTIGQHGFFIQLITKYEFLEKKFGAKKITEFLENFVEYCQSNGLKNYLLSPELLAQATKQRQYKLIEFFIKNGVDVTEPLYDGKNCIALVVASFDMELIKTYFEYASKYNRSMFIVQKNWGTYHWFIDAAVSRRREAIKTGDPQHLAKVNQDILDIFKFILQQDNPNFIYDNLIGSIYTIIPIQDPTAHIQESKWSPLHLIAALGFWELLDVLVTHIAEKNTKMLREAFNKNNTVYNAEQPAEQPLIDKTGAPLIHHIVDCLLALNKLSSLQENQPNAAATQELPPIAQQVTYGGVKDIEEANARLAHQLSQWHSALVKQPGLLAQVIVGGRGIISKLVGLAASIRVPILETKNTKGETVLLRAVQAGDTVLVEHLLARGADVTATLSVYGNPKKVSMVSCAVSNSKLLDLILLYIGRLSKQAVNTQKEAFELLTWAIESHQLMPCDELKAVMFRAATAINTLPKEQVVDAKADQKSRIKQIFWAVKMHRLVSDAMTSIKHKQLSPLFESTKSMLEGIILLPTQPNTEVIGDKERLALIHQAIDSFKAIKTAAKNNTSFEFRMSDEFKDLILIAANGGDRFELISAAIAICRTVNLMREQNPTGEVSTLLNSTYEIMSKMIQLYAKAEDMEKTYLGTQLSKCLEELKIPVPVAKPAPTKWW